MSDTLSPTQRIVEAANARTTVKDGEGREITFRTLSALDKMMIGKLCAPEDSGKASYMYYVFVGYAVSSIDGVPVPPPRRMAELENTIARLGDVGIAAIFDHYAAEAEEAAKAAE